MIEQIAAYYSRIDEGDLTIITELFHPEAIYNRAGQRLRGLAEIASFYQAERKISGRHIVDHIANCGDVIVVEGRFEGQGEDGTPRHVQFADIWRHRDGKVHSRASYLAIGQDFVTR